MMHLLEKVRKYLQRGKTGHDGKLPFKVVFSRFRQVLDSNNRCLELMADMGDKLSGDYIFDVKYIKSVYADLADTLFKSIYNLNALARNRHLRLHGIYEKINSQVNSALQGKSPSGLTEPVLFYRDISWETADEVGGKNAGIAELYNYLKINVPLGFAVTTSAFRRFVEYNHIDEKANDIRQKYMKSSGRPQHKDVMSAITFAEAGEHETAKEILREEHHFDENYFNDVRELYLKGDMPPDVKEAVSDALDKLKQEYGDTCFIAVRSSAEEEDGEFSFAGQFETVLNVPAEIKHVEKAYKEVLSSLFLPGAIAYKEQIMPKDSVISMSVGCVVMVDAETSGVMYSADPADLDNNAVVINANFGLGKTVVDGSVDADHYLVNRDGPHDILYKKIGKKDKAAIRAKGGGIEESYLPEEKRNGQCLSDEQMKKLAGLATTIEHYFKKPQDIEWAIDRQGSIFILQSRPLRISPEGAGGSPDMSAALKKYRVVMKGQGMIAQRGIGAGKVFILRSMDDLKDFVPGSVLVAEHDSSHFIRIMPKASAIITNIGTPTSHMSNIAREFQVPTIVNTGTGIEDLKNETEITVDAGDNIVYSGIIKELLRYKISEEIDLKGTREFRLLKKILRYITPLNLIDPLLENFTPEGCKTFHDIIRFIHEKAIAELVNVERYEGDLLKDNVAVRLEISIPTGIMVIDIGGGLDLKPGKRTAGLDEIISIPFRSILEGMMHPGVWHSESVAMRVNDFMSSMMKMPDVASMRYLGDNIAVVSREYVNLSLRFGYHFNMLDCYCSENVRDNHIYFRFVGGATDITKRSRRAELLSFILREYNLTVNVKGDLVIGRTGNITMTEMEDILNRLGRLIAYTRQLDALLDDDETVTRYAGNFLKSVYELD